MKEKKTIARREFLENIGRAAGSSVMVRAMVAMGLGSGLSSCGSSAAESPVTANNSNVDASQSNLNIQKSNPVSLGNYTSLKSPRPGDWPVNSGSGKSVIILGC